MCMGYTAKAVTAYAVSCSKRLTICAKYLGLHVFITLALFPHALRPPGLAYSFGLFGLIFIVILDRPVDC